MTSIDDPDNHFNALIRLDGQESVPERLSPKRGHPTEITKEIPTGTENDPLDVAAEEEAPPVLPKVEEFHPEVNIRQELRSASVMCYIL